MQRTLLTSPYYKHFKRRWLDKIQIFKNYSLSLPLPKAANVMVQLILNINLKLAPVRAHPFIFF